jgi:NADP-dependent 3-hydroxy acid dehydrogenase YdfG
MTGSARPLAVVTGASAGIGAATARALAAGDYEVLLGARRQEKVEALAAEIGGRAAYLDVTDGESVGAFAAQARNVRLLVNNAGAAFGVDPVAAGDPAGWRAMYEVNVIGVLHTVRALLPALEASGDGHVINVGSVSGFETYKGGGGYTATKHALRALTKTLRLELLGKPVRITEICPGLVESEFSTVRLGDEQRASEVYRGMTPLTPEDIAEAIAWAASRPSHVNVDEIVIRPRDQATAHHVHRRTD